MTKLRRENFVNARVKFLILAVILFWVKTLFSYKLDFNLGVQGVFQTFILFINPIATTVLILGLSLYIKKPKRSYLTMIVLYFIMTILLYANILYYREYTDFLSINTMLGVSNVAEGLNDSIIALLRPRDILYWMDFFILIGVLIASKNMRKDKVYMEKRTGIAFTIIAGLVFLANLTAAEIDRPQLLTRTFDQSYIVKYLGINSFTGYDAFRTFKIYKYRADADSIDVGEAVDYVEENKIENNPELTGIAKGKNVVYLHLESIEQFLIDYKVDGEEVLPFLNSLYNDPNTFSFNNVYHQTGQGKSSDAENLLENSLFGLSRGAAFSQIGKTNVFQGLPSILKQDGYTTSAFHSNKGSFWNRNNTFKNLGYDYFFDLNFFKQEEETTTTYGLKDKQFYEQSMDYLKKLPQPFYSKFITVSNHFPYPVETDEEGNRNFPDPGTDDETINGYFSTSHYADEALEELFSYFKESGLYENSIFVLYGDHYGISRARHPELAELIGKESKDMTSFDDTMLQKVPVMIHVPGAEGQGGVVETVGGQVDVLPTVLNLLGIDSSSYINIGSDLLSPNRKSQVTFRNGDIVTDKYTLVGSKIYDSKTGKELSRIDEVKKAEIDGIKEWSRKQLYISDIIMTGDLLRFYTPDNYKKIDTSETSFKKEDQLKKLNKSYNSYNEKNKDKIENNSEELLE